MQRWASLYNPAKWGKKDKTWRALRGIYAGESFEQGSFELGIWRVADYASWIENKPNRVLNYLPKVEMPKWPKDVFAVHYWKGNRKIIQEHWR
jgi:hypothetical protein